jgi:DNA-binding MarR family transcriptional regulator
MDRSTLEQNLRPPVRAGLITMTPSNGDARSKQISLSARGCNGRNVMNALAMNQQL